MDKLPQRRRLGHTIPEWVKGTALCFVTICTTPRHKNQLCTPLVGLRVLQSAAYYHSIGRWWLQVILLMPDHLHALACVPKGDSLPDVFRMWKGYQAKTCGIVWQDGFFDHRLRNGESEQEKTDYILMNPVRAGLVANVGEWPYVWPEDYVTLAARRQDSPYL